MNEADTCRTYVLPKLYSAGWLDDQISEQRYFTDGRVLIFKDKCRRKKQKRADYLLKYRRDFPLAVVEAKADYRSPGDGIQQAKEYAEILGLKFAYATNGKGIVEFDFITGKETEGLPTFPSPEDLWKRVCGHEKIASKNIAEKLLSPYYYNPEKEPRYYQVITINRVVKNILSGQKRVLLTMATGTGKTEVAFQIAWKLWNARWNVKGEDRHPRILFLSDRSILVDDPKDKTFIPFGDALLQLESPNTAHPTVLWCDAPYSLRSTTPQNFIVTKRKKLLANKNKIFILFNFFYDNEIFFDKSKNHVSF